MTDLTDRFNELSQGNASIPEQWENNPEPDACSIDGGIIMEQTGNTWWVWDSHNANTTLEFTGETAPIEQ